MAVERLDCRIDIEDPRLGEQRLHAKGQTTAQPGRAFRLVDHLERAPDRVLAHDFRHAEQRRLNPVPAHRRDMRVPLGARQHRKHRSAQDVPLLRRVGAPVPQRAIRHESVEQPRRLQIVDEERKLPKRRHRRLVVPLDPHRPAEAVDIDPGGVPLDNQGLFTRQVRPKGSEIARHALQNARFLASRQRANRCF